jgi:hypothetical protein
MVVGAGELAGGIIFLGGGWGGGSLGSMPLH